MIIVKSPFRVSFFGGGTDFPEWFNKFGGQVISSTINYHSYLLINNNLKKKKYNFRYSTNEEVNHINSIKHPCFRNFCKYYKIKNININFHSDLPSFSGLASSSSLSVGLLNYFLKIRKKKNYSKYNLAHEAIKFERNILRENIGFQDQISISYGGMNYIKFNNNLFKVNKLKISPKKKKFFENNFFLLDSGIKRFSTLIQKNLIKSFEKSRIKNQHLSEMSKFVDIANNFLKSGDIDSFGRLLDEYWTLKVLSNPMAVNQEIKIIYDLAKKHGAIGGKLLGAGSGGFFLFYVPEKNKNNFFKLKKKFRILPLLISEEGSKVYEI